MESILNSTKKALGLAADYQPFDPELIIHINSVFSTLQQLGVGPDDGFEISDSSARWGDYLGDDKNLSQVKTYLYLRVKLLFDPPGTSYLLESINKQVQELEWRLNVYVEGRDG